MTLRSLAPEASASANSATSAYKNLKLLLGSNPKPRWVLITLIHIYDEPESSQANKFTVVTLPEASASANSATSAYKNLKLLLGSNPKPRWVLITLIHIYDEPESSQANKFTVVTLPEASASANSATSAYKNLKLLLGSNPKPRWVLITLIHIYDEPESSQANKFTVVTLPEASASANSATSAYLTLLNATYLLYHITRTLSILFRSFFDKNAKK